MLLQQCLIARLGRVRNHQGAADRRVGLSLDGFLGPVTKLAVVLDKCRPGVRLVKPLKRYRCLPKVLDVKQRRCRRIGIKGFRGTLAVSGDD